MIEGLRSRASAFEAKATVAASLQGHLSTRKLLHQEPHPNVRPSSASPLSYVKLYTKHSF
jgi:hypothetical protein